MMSFSFAKASRISSSRLSHSNDKALTPQSTFQQRKYCNETTKSSSATDKRSSGVTPQHFPFATYATGEGQTVLGRTLIKQRSNATTAKSTISAPKLASMLQMQTKQNVLKRTDLTADVFLSQPPLGHTEHKDAKAGCQQYFVNENGPSTFAVQFQSEYTHHSSLEEYVKVRKQQFHDQYEGGLIYPISLSPTLTSYLTKSKIPFEVLFYCLTKDQPAVGMMSLHLQTPGGFWDFSWISTADNIQINRNIYFGDMLKKIKIRWKSSPSVTKAETVSILAASTPALASPESSTSLPSPTSSTEPTSLVPTEDTVVEKH